jgi:hypothetical protein
LIAHSSNYTWPIQTLSPNLDIPDIFKLYFPPESFASHVLSNQSHSRKPWPLRTVGTTIVGVPWYKNIQRGKCDRIPRSCLPPSPLTSMKFRGFIKASRNIICVSRKSRKFIALYYHGTPTIVAPFRSTLNEVRSEIHCKYDFKRAPKTTPRSGTSL